MFPESAHHSDRAGAVSSPTTTRRTARRVCVIGDNVRKQLFGTRPDAPGAQISLNGLPYRIVGIMADKNQNSSYSGLDEKKICAPLRHDGPRRPADRRLLRAGHIWTKSSTSRVACGITKKRARQVKRVLARDHHFDPVDKSAVGIWDTVERSETGRRRSSIR